jgi:hypothetical protein
LLVFVYALLLCQEIVVNQVICFKNNGEADLELAIMGIECGCKKAHLHGHEPKLANCCQLLPRFDFCYDLLLNNPWLERDISPDTPEIKIIKQYELTDSIDSILTEPFKQLPESVPVSKFVYPLPFLNGSVILRC